MNCLEFLYRASFFFQWNAFYVDFLFNAFYGITLNVYFDNFGQLYYVQIYN